MSDIIAEVAVDDPLINLWSDVQQQRARIARIADPTPKKALTELNETGLSVMEELLSYLVGFRQYVSESLEDVDGRLGVLEDDVTVPPLLSQEEAAMILALSNACEAFTTVIRDSSVSINDEARQKLDETMALVARVRAWVAENIEDGDDEADESAADSQDEPS